MFLAFFAFLLFVAGNAAFGQQLPEERPAADVAGKWTIYSKSDDGKTAFRVDMQLGNKNTDYYEVLQGLKPGDKVITSSYENYGNYQELVLKK